MNDSTQQRLKKILVDELSYPLSEDKIREDTSLFGNGLGLSSLDVVSLLVRIEEEFSIIFDANEIDSMLGTFGALLLTLQQKLRQDGTTVQREKGEKN